MGTEITTAWATVKAQMEADAKELEQQRRLHLADACQIVLTANADYWAVYQRAIGAGLPSEFQKAKPHPARPTPVDRVYFRIEALARQRVAASSDPITLRSAVQQLADDRPDLLESYRRATKKLRRARAGTRKTAQ